MLREENYQLKNEITDLKNAFDLNRDILKILSTYNARADPQHNLLLQIITRLTTVNNQSMLNCIELIQEKNILKQEVSIAKCRTWDWIWRWRQWRKDWQHKFKITDFVTCLTSLNCWCRSSSTISINNCLLQMNNVLPRIKKFNIGRQNIQ